MTRPLRQCPPWPPAQGWPDKVLALLSAEPFDTESFEYLGAALLSEAPEVTEGLLCARHRTQAWRYCDGSPMAAPDALPAQVPRAATNGPSGLAAVPL